jgi:hypothetical protein
LQWKWDGWAGITQGFLRQWKYSVRYHDSRWRLSHTLVVKAQFLVILENSSFGSQWNERHRYSIIQQCWCSEKSWIHRRAHMKFLLKSTVSFLWQWKVAGNLWFPTLENDKGWENYMCTYIVTWIDLKNNAEWKNAKNNEISLGYNNIFLFKLKIHIQNTTTHFYNHIRHIKIYSNHLRVGDIWRTKAGKCKNKMYMISGKLL